MNKPNFVCGAYNVTIEHPTESTRDNVIVENVEETLNGTVVGDILARKFKYNLSFNGLSKAEFDSLYTLYLYHIDNRTPVTFTYPKWSTTVSGVNCQLRISSEKIKGSGNTDYRVIFDITLVEVSSRI